MRVARPEAIVWNLGIYSLFSGHCGRDWNKDAYSIGVLDFSFDFFFETGSLFGSVTVLELSL